MAVTAIPVGTRLSLRLNTGLDENFNPVYRTRSWSNVKPAATHANLHAVAQGFGGLQVHNLEAIRRMDENELEAE
jgi:hypothetical protein